MRVLTLDFETYYTEGDYTLKKLSTSEYITDARFRCLGFALKDGEKPAVWVPENLVGATLTALRPTLETNALLAHHAQFDGLILSHHYGIRPRMWFDTLSMARGAGLHSTVGGSLKKLVAHFQLGEKAELTDTSTAAQLQQRGTVDAELTWQLFKKLMPGYPQSELELIDETIRWFTEPRMLADVAGLTAFADKARADKDARMSALGITEADLQSAERFCALLEAQGVEIEYKDGKNGPIPAIAKTDGFMEELADSDDPVVQALAASRLGVKSTGDESRARRYVDMAAHGPLPVYLNYASTQNLRWSGGDKTNFQNLRRGGELRRGLLAPPGYVFVVADLAQIEARVNALWSGQRDLVEAFREEHDVYSEFATRLFDRECSKETKYERFIGKFWILGGGYGMGATKGAAQFNAELRKQGLDYDKMTPGTAKGHINMYRMTYPSICDNWRRAEGLLTGDYPVLGPVRACPEGVLLPNGMKIRYPGLQRSSDGWSYQGKKNRNKLWGGDVVAHCVSALARIILSDALLYVRGRFKADKVDGKVVSTSHDELIAITPLGSVDWLRGEMQHAMTRVPAWMPTLPLACEIGVGERYGDCK